jgi:hypothetical protein
MATINDLVLVHLDRKPAFYARINDINPDVKRGWYQVELLVLALPSQTLVWIMEDVHLHSPQKPARTRFLPPGKQGQGNPPGPQALKGALPYLVSTGGLVHPILLPPGQLAPDK